MNRQEDTMLLSRYLDGDLSNKEEVALKKRILAEPALSSEFSRMKTVNDLLKQHFNSSSTKIVPPSTAAMMGSSETNVNNIRTKHNSLWQFATAATAVAAIGLLLVREWSFSPTSQPVLFDQDQLVSEALEQAPSSADSWVSLADGRKLRPVLTFPHANGSWCREYNLSTESVNWKGIACRSAKNDEWITQALGAESAIDPIVDKYRPAGADENGEIGTFIRENASDIPVSVSQEQKLIESGWKTSSES